MHADFYENVAKDGEDVANSTKVKVKFPNFFMMNMMISCIQMLRMKRWNENFFFGGEWIIID